MGGHTLILASSNLGKVREMEAILAPLGILVRRIGEVIPDFDVVEDGDTFAANAEKKALAAFLATGAPALADDSGLCVTALDGAPGVHSARFGGSGLTDNERAERLLSAIYDATRPRRAWFQCALVAALPASWLVAPDAHPTAPGLPEDHRLVTVEGRLKGVIGDELRGDSGFGYDPIFQPTGYRGATLAEIDAGEKNRISHRALALASLLALLVPAQ
ncbi:MAG: non-canonical purine NTP pyrophosphatase [Pseudomonadota bacterium]